jgi:putative ABC transport system permease protein
MRLRRHIKLSLRALFSHRVRTVLAISSICIGVAAVVVTSALGAGAQRSVSRSIERVGTNLLVVRPVAVQRFAGRRELKGTVTTLRAEDYRAIAALPSVANAAAAIEGAVRVKSLATSTMTTLRGTTPAYPAVRRFSVASGRFFDADDDRLSRRVVVLGSRVATTLFDDDPVGREVRIRGMPFDVIGVLAPKGVVADGDEDNQVVVPIRTALRRVFNADWLNAVFVSAADARTTRATEAQLAEVLGQRHRPGRDGQPDFEIQNTARFFALQKQAADSLSKLSTGIAGISLVVGGVGIMGLMLLSVKERTSEIGLRRAVGATPRDVLIQFLLEASVLAFGGWAVGILLGGAGAAALKAITQWEIAAPAQSIVASFGMTVIIGLGFGSIPARKASAIPPVQALVSR